MQNTVLQEFQEFLSASNLVPEKYIQFYALWASKFLVYSKENGKLTFELRIKQFLDDLRNQHKDMSQFLDRCLGLCQVHGNDL